MRSRNSAIFVMIVALLAASCGGGVDDQGGQTAAPSTSTSTTTTSSTTPTTATTASTSPPTTTTPPTTVVGVPTLKESRGAKSGAGSLLAPGTYRSASPRVAAEYELKTEVSVFLARTLIAFGPPDFDPFSDPTLTVSALTGVPAEENVDALNESAAPPVVPIAGSDDLTAFLDTTPGIVLLDSGSDGATSWWDFTTAADGGGFPYAWGDHCRNIVAIPEHGYAIIGEDWTVRMWRFESDTEPVYAWLQAPNSDFVAALEWGQAIVDGMTVD